MDDERLTELTDRLVDLAAQAIVAGDDGLALQALSDVLTREPNHPGALWQVGRYYGRKGAYAEAAQQYTTAVRLDPRLSRVEFAVRGQVISLRDIEGSTMPAEMLEEFSRGMYDLETRSFAAGDVVVDIGAHIGTVSIIVAKLYPEVRVIAYEPSSHNFAMLAANLRENGVQNVVAVQEAVAGAAGTLELLWSPTHSAGAATGLSETARRSRESSGWERETVRCITLDDLFARHAIERCAFLKLDCEGAEWGILRDAAAVERVDSAALELHLPASRQAEGVEALQQEFAGLLTRRPKFPTTKISSTVWVLDS